FFFLRTARTLATASRLLCIDLTCRDSLSVEDISASKISNDRSTACADSTHRSGGRSAVLRYFDLRRFFVLVFFLARSSCLAIFFSLGFAKSIVRMTLFRVLDIAPSSHWTSNNDTINEPGFGASGFARE